MESNLKEINKRNWKVKFILENKDEKSCDEEGPMFFEADVKQMTLEDELKALYRKPRKQVNRVEAQSIESKVFPQEDEKSYDEEETKHFQVGDKKMSTKEEIWTSVLDQKLKKHFKQAKSQSIENTVFQKDDGKRYDEVKPMSLEVGDQNMSSGEGISTSELGQKLKTLVKQVEDQSIESTVFQQVPSSKNFVRKVWTAFLTFNVFVIPAIIGMILSCVSLFGFLKNNDQYQDMTNCIMMGFLAASVVIGLPFHMLALADLEEAVNTILQSADITRDQETQEDTSYDTCESSSDYDSDDSVDDNHPYFYNFLDCFFAM